MLQCDQDITQVGDLVTRNNAAVKQYLKEQFKYEFCTTSIKIDIQAFDQDPNLLARYLGGSEHNADFMGFVKDMEFELSKFGPIKQIKVLRANDPEMQTR